MKRIFFCITLALALSFSLSCAKQEAAESAERIPPAGEEASADLSDESMTISVGLQDTKVEVSPVGKVTWSANDHIAVFKDGVAYDFVLKSGEGSASALFTCTDLAKGTTLDGVAVYPYRESLTYDSATGALQVYVPREQSYALSSAPMVATAAEPGSLNYQFHNLGGLFDFTYNNMPPEAKKLKFTATSDLNGIFTLASPAARLSTADSSAPLASENTKEIVVDLPVVRPDGSVSVQVPVPAGDYSGFALDLCLADGTVIQDIPGLPNTHKAPATTVFAAKTNTLSPIRAIDLPEGVKIQWMWDNEESLATFTGNVPAIDADGNVYVQTGYDNKIFKLDRDGQKVWEFPLTGVSSRCNTSPSLEEDGSVVYALGANTAGQGKMFAINASDGSKKWECTDYPAFVSPRFDKAMTAVGEGNNVYVPVNWSGGSTVLSIRKSDGHCVCYSSSNEEGSGATLRATPGGIAISSVGLVCYQTNDGAAFMRQSLMDNPTTSHATHGPYVWYAYRDLWPGNWGGFFNSTQGIVCGRKGPTSGKNIVISCAQETIKNESDVNTGSRMDIYCSSADEAVTLNGFRQQDVAYDNADWHAFWRYQYGSHSTAGRPGYQDQGGMIMGHDDLELLLPLKSNEISTGKDDKGRSVGPGGVVSIWIDRSADKPSTRGTSACWRFNINTAAYANESTHSIESVAEVSGSPAVDNNGWVHVGSRDCYHIFSAATGSPYTITYHSRVNWVDLLNASGYFSKTVTTANPWTSVKIGDDGRIYFNLSVTFADATTRGVVLCLTYPGVLSPDSSSSWPQKGADARNSCRQVTDASYWHTDVPTIPWD